MTALALLNPQEPKPDLKALSTPDLRSLLAQVLIYTAHGLLSAALIVREMESRGEDLSRLRIGFKRWMARIAAGDLLPEVVLNFPGNRLLINRLARLSVDEQRKYVDGEPVTLVVLRPDGTPDRTAQDPTALEPAQIEQVFAPDHVRTEPEQLNWLRVKNEKKTAARPTRIGSLKLDHELATATPVSRDPIPLSDLDAAVKALRR